MLDEKRRFGSATVLLLWMSGACGSSRATIDVAQERPPDGLDGPVDMSVDVMLDESPGDHASEDGPDTETPGDIIDWDAALDCNGMTCGAGEVCVEHIGGIDGAAATFHCDPLMECGIDPTCDCVRTVLQECSVFQCVSLGPRRFACGEGA